MDHKTKMCGLSIFLLVAALTVFGLFMVKEASSVWAAYLYGDTYYFFKRQLIFVIVGFIALAGGYLLKPDWIYRFIDIILAISIVLLILVLIPGVGQIKNGSRSWFGIGSFGFQPSELFKMVYLVWVAKFLSIHYKESVKLKTLLPVFFIAAVGFALTMGEPDFGTALVTLMGLAMLVFISRLQARYFIILGSMAVAGFVVLIVAEPYRFSRITSFIDPYQDPLGAGFQMIQSLYSLGPAGLAGLGYGSSIQKNYYLPEPQTDFIFAIIVEEFGLLGGLLVVALYAVLFWRCYRYALKFRTFTCFMKIGLINVIMMQTIINLGVVVGILPVTGITLPLISYGGSSLLVTMFSFGIIIQKGDLDENNTISLRYRRPRIAAHRHLSAISKKKN